jgi:hypothetical protein
MTKVESGRPDTTEYAEYYGRYVGKVEGSDIVGVLEGQLDRTLALLRGIDERTADFRYEPGKWSVKELLGHLMDTERVFAYRALVFLRNDKAALPGFDQDLWAKEANYSDLPFSEIVQEFEAVRRATIQLLRHVDASGWTRQGTANGKTVTTRALAFLMAGHLEHHVGILKERYLLL